jgi:hypothetical protein
VAKVGGKWNLNHFWTEKDQNLILISTLGRKKNLYTTAPVVQV